MWIILVHHDQASHRDIYISNLIDNQTIKEEYLSLRVSRYFSTSYIGSAKIYKSKSGAEKIIKQFNNNDNNNLRNKFSWIKYKHLTYRKLSISEWDSIMDNKIQNLEFKYKNQRNKLEIKKNGYRH